MTNQDALLFRMQAWWSSYYSRPLKDPILQSYTLEELLYEYYDKIERSKVAEENKIIEEENQETECLQDNLDWAEQEEMKELANNNNIKQKLNETITKTKTDEEWMRERIIEEEKAQDSSFGEDINLDFEE